MIVLVAPFQTAFIFRSVVVSLSSTKRGGMKGNTAKALWDFQATSDQELSFQAGDIITDVQ